MGVIGKLDHLGKHTALGPIQVLSGTLVFPLEGSSVLVLCRLGSNSVTWGIIGKLDYRCNRTALGPIQVLCGTLVSA